MRYPKGTFSTHFFILGIFRVTVLSSKCFEKNITIWLYQKGLYQGRFPKYVFRLFFRDSKTQNSYTCLVSQIIIVVVRSSHQRCSVKKVFLEISQNLKDTTGLFLGTPLGGCSWMSTRILTKFVIQYLDKIFRFYVTTLKW